MLHSENVLLKKKKYSHIVDVVVISGIQQSELVILIPMFIVLLFFLKDSFSV